jgi:hypothetical protein
MAFPLITALAVAGVTTSALLTALAIVSGFLAHEPALVLLGMRGPRAKRELLHPARLWLLLLGSIAAVAGVSAIRLAPAHVLWSYMLPLVPAGLLVIAIASRQEKSWHAEIAVALTFSLAALPLSLASGSAVRVALSVAIPFALIFVAGTLAVRTVILRVRGGGDARATAATRVAVIVFAIAATALLAVAGRYSIVSWAVFLATLPGLAFAVGVAMSSPSPTRLKTIGWSLVAVSTLAAVTVIIGL